MLLDAIRCCHYGAMPFCCHHAPPLRFRHAIFYARRYSRFRSIFCHLRAFERAFLPSSRRFSSMLFASVLRASYVAAGKARHGAHHVPPVPPRLAIFEIFSLFTPAC